MWVMTYDEKGQRLGRVNVNYLIQVFPVEAVHEAEGRQWWELHAQVDGAEMDTIRLSGEDFYSLEKCIDAIDELDLTPRVMGTLPWLK